MRVLMAGIGLLVITHATAVACAAQSLRSRVEAVRSGSVRFEFPAADGVCGNGRSNISIRRGSVRLSGGSYREREWEDECEPGPVRIALDVARGEVTEVRAYVGGRWRGMATADLGEVSAADASEYLLALAESGSEDVAKEAIFPAILGEGVQPWPRLLRIAKDTRRPREVRNSAVFWVGQGAAEAATKGLQELVDDPDGDREVRKSAVFALSQRPKDESVPALLRIAKAHRDPEMRRSAIFWLGQSNDPRALAYFEELLVSK
jgi:hypothetical protein